MALFGRLILLAKSPQGRRLLAKAGKAARDPQNRERLEKVRSRIQNRGDASPKSAAPGPTVQGPTVSDPTVSDPTVSGPTAPEPTVPGQSGAEGPRATEPRP